MRKADREVQDPARIAAILEECRVCRLGLSGDGPAYIVPMNYGYTYEGGALALYFHCAPEGRRLELLARDPEVGFELDCCREIIGAGDVPCAYSCSYSSVIGHGRAEFLTGPSEKLEGLRRIMRHVAGRDFSFTEGMAQGVTVFRVIAEAFTCKERT